MAGSEWDSCNAPPATLAFLRDSGPSRPGRTIAKST
jgi:hypothetical protein